MLNEHDLKDWEKGEVTELYNVPRNTWVEVVMTGDVFKFFRLDGMYSYCEDHAGNVVHLSVGTEVFPLKEKNEEV